MSQICDLNDRLSRAGDLSSVLAAAHEAFDGILLAIRGREDPVTGMFAALVMAAASAADGRDAVTRAPSLPLAALRHAVLTRRAGHPGGRGSRTLPGLCCAWSPGCPVASPLPTPVPATGPGGAPGSPARGRAREPRPARPSARPPSSFARTPAGRQVPEPARVRQRWPLRPGG